MKTTDISLMACVATLLVTGTAAGQQLDLGNRSIQQAVAELKNEQYVSAPQLGG